MTEPYLNQTVWIIGASSGIGKALAYELHERGARLILSARSKDKLDELAGSLNRNHIVLPLDVAKEDAFEKAFRTLQKADTLPDRMVTLAAIYEPGPVDGMDLKKASRLIDINLKGTLSFVQTALEIARTRRAYTQIAVCGSVAGYSGLPNGQPYSATKAAVMNFAESLRAECQSDHIDIRLISPGFVDTPMTKKNDFSMPMMVTPQEAAASIADGLAASVFEIHFPKRFTFLVKFMRILPYGLFFPLMKKAMTR
ncbi:MAG: SDR family NAD(P)-dependent oxidoreductase [Pseudobdellovibrionaceae bacterium]